MTELNESIVKWINELPESDQEKLGHIDQELELLIDLLKDGREIHRLRELYRKLADDLDKDENQ